MTSIVQSAIRRLFNAVPLAVLVSGTAAVPSAAQSISIEGSDTLGDKLVPRLIEAYHAIGHRIEFQVSAEGSSSAFTGLESGTADIGMSSRPIKPSEKASLEAAGKPVREHVAAVDMIAVIINDANPVENVPAEAVEQIFTGKVGTWKTLPGQPAVEAFTRNDKSGTYKVFQELAMGGKPYAESSQKQPDNDRIVEAVASHPGGVGYVGLSYATADGVKPVAIDGIAPKPDNAATYPLSRKLFYYTIKGETGEDALAFIRWANSSDEAAEIIRDVGFLPAGE